MNLSWPKWVAASMFKNMQDVVEGAGKLKVYIETSPRKLDNLTDWCEVRLDGPKFKGLSQDIWQMDVELDVVVSSALDDLNNYRIHANLGIVLGAFTTTIPLLKLGKTTADDGSFVDCMRLDTVGKNNLSVNKFGQVGAVTELMQASINAHYTAILQG